MYVTAVCVYVDVKRFQRYDFISEDSKQNEPGSELLNRGSMAITEWIIEVNLLWIWLH